VPFLHPYPQRNSVLVLDNWSVHHTPEVRRVIESTGAKILYLPCVARLYVLWVCHACVWGRGASPPNSNKSNSPILTAPD